MQSEAEPQLRAWVEYFRDLGVYDFYRNGEPVSLGAQKAEAGVYSQWSFRGAPGWLRERRLARLRRSLREALP